MIKLRPYQEEALQSVIDEHGKGINRQLIILPCGTGKTIVMAAIVKHFKKRTLIIAHRDELIQQTKDKLLLYWPKARIGICKANENNLHKKIVIGSIQTCSRENRLAQLKKEGFEILLIDEAHHGCAPTYRKLISELGFDSNKLMIGFTATPERTRHKEQLGDVFEKTVYLRSISTMIAGKYLCPVIGRKILTTTSLIGIKTQMGDFNQGQLSTRVDTEERNKFIVSKYRQYTDGRKGVAFCVNVKHAQALAAAFNKENIKAAPIWGDMPYDDRKKTLQDLANGNITIATSVGILTEGYDETSLEVALMCTPTKSRVKYVQCVGRILRLHPGKKYATVLDFSDISHNLDSIMTLKKTIETAPELIDDEAVEPKKKPAQEVSNAPVVEFYNEEFDLLGKQRFCWIDIGDNEYSLIDDERNEIVIHRVKDGYIGELYKANSIHEQIITKPLPFNYCIGCAEDYARRNLSIKFANINNIWMKNWQKYPPTTSQLEFLKKHQIPVEGISKLRAMYEIRRIIALQHKAKRNNIIEPITDKQKFYLMRNGVNVEGLNKTNAMKMISLLKTGIRPEGINLYFKQ